MNFDTLASLLTQIEDKSLFLQFNPEVLDFTDNDFEPELNFSFQGGTSFQIVLKKETMPLILSFLSISLFEKDYKVFTWNWKSFVSYIYARTGKFYDIKASLIDIKVLETYVGIKKSCPETYVEAFNRIKSLVSSGMWKESENV